MCLPGQNATFLNGQAQKFAATAMMSIGSARSLPTSKHARAAAAGAVLSVASMAHVGYANANQLAMRQVSPPTGGVDLFGRKGADIDYGAATKVPESRSVGFLSLSSGSIRNAPTRTR
jgi:hypothetical protein